ncbi:MAG: chitobiase/beta-hexosaminidase C-terminal domain-containing protein [Deltaproteobacteria bacterium]|nr:chitobiase/beta-hexosaminidase C-terminal domain-containing protein [Deltaproteobacteria bacterium]
MTDRFHGTGWIVLLILALLGAPTGCDCGGGDRDKDEIIVIINTGDDDDDDDSVGITWETTTTTTIDTTTTTTEETSTTTTVEGTTTTTEETTTTTTVTTTTSTTSTTTPVIDNEPPVTTTNPEESGWIYDDLTIVMHATDNVTPNPTIYYTLDGTAPSINSAATFSGRSPVVLTGLKEATRLRFFAVDDAGNQEFPQSRYWNLCVGTPSPGNYPGPNAELSIAPLEVELNCTAVDEDEPATLYYTLDGTEPQVGGETTIEAPSPISLEVLETTTLRFFSETSVEFSPRGTFEYGVWGWDDFEDDTPGEPPSSMWQIDNNGADTIVPTVLYSGSPLPQDGNILQIADTVDVPPNPPETFFDWFAAAYYYEPLEWPETLIVRFEMRLAEGDEAGFGTFHEFVSPENGFLRQPWRVLIFFRAEGFIEAWDEASGDWVECEDYEKGKWYRFTVLNDRETNLYSFSINGKLSRCVDLMTKYEEDEIDPPSSVTGVRVATQGPTVGTIEFDNFQIAGQ